MSFGQIRRTFRTVGFRIALWHSITFGVGAILVFCVAYFLLRHSIDEQTRDSIEFRLNQFHAEYKRGGKDSVVQLCKLRLGRTQKAFFVRLADPENKTIFLRDAEDWAEFRPQVLEGGSAESQVSWTELSGLEGSVLNIATERMEDGFILQVGKTMESRQELLGRFRWALTAIAAVVIIAGVLGGASVAFRALRPVHQLTANVKTILDTGKFSARVPFRNSGDEIDELVQCFNAMLGKIDLLIHGMRDSLDNVAHDIRTPLTRLRNIATKALEQDYNQSACQEALGDCLEESERVLTMMMTLMDIAEAQTGVMKLRFQPVNVALLTSRIIDLYEHVAEEKGITIQSLVPAGLVVSGDPGRLLRALGNLVDNALKYTSRQGRVDIQAREVEGGLEIVIKDNGIGMAESELDRIWERLYRIDKSRSQRGLGLGLSFVKAIVEAHGGKASVVSTPGKGSEFTLYFPNIAHLDGAESDMMQPSSIYSGV